MNDPNLVKSGWDTALLAAPMLGLLFLSLFRVDAIFSAPPRRPGSQKHGAHLPVPFCDPDCRPWPDPAGRGLDRPPEEIAARKTP